MPTTPAIACPCGGRRQAGQPCDRCKSGGRAPEHRPNFRQRGYSVAWDKARKTWLVLHPLCAECEAAGRVVAGYAVDHIQPHRGDQELFWNQANWQTLCRRCHAVKSAAERTTGGGSQVVA